jgi:hypothetical protein
MNIILFGVWDEIKRWSPLPLPKDSDAISLKSKDRRIRLSYIFKKEDGSCYTQD